MFYPVKVRDNQGKVKKVVSTKQLSDRHWEHYKKVTEVIRPPLPNTLGVRNNGQIKVD